MALLDWTVSTSSHPGGRCGARRPRPGEQGDGPAHQGLGQVLEAVVGQGGEVGQDLLAAGGEALLLRAHGFSLKMKTSYTRV